MKKGNKLYFWSRLAFFPRLRWRITSDKHFKIPMQDFHRCCISNHLVDFETIHNMLYVLNWKGKKLANGMQRLIGSRQPWNTWLFSNLTILNANIKENVDLPARMLIMGYILLKFKYNWQWWDSIFMNLPKFLSLQWNSNVKQYRSSRYIYI